MPLPLLWIGGAAIGAVLLADEREKRQQLERDRLLGRAAKQLLTHRAMVAAPSQWQKGFTQVMPVPGSIVCCYVFGVIEHTGIWLGDDCLVELHGSGLVRAVSIKRFLAGRTGSQIYLACSHLHQPLVAEAILNRAEQAIYQYREYDLFDNNCHRFVWACISGHEVAIKSFNELNQKLAVYFGEGIYWDEIQEPSSVYDFSD
ncbi:lecithin retinol acyltransferase family protein [Shewanella profunda]|uniref:lecithin retinol acyltransferase family protein n=1 Tax=Shewanella profunda TaxID=254793 RepID=UPI00200F70D0|nr:lecithin retinol acyltransferase family protein [Shewanella profunda]MCL1090437.1 lecithin retinol acyltransferase family protein [Shewanella profunda]